MIIGQIMYLETRLFRARAFSLASDFPARDILTAGIRYATNHFINHIPSYTARHAWYQRVLGWEVDASATIKMGQRIEFVSRLRNGRRVSIGADTVIGHDCLLSTTGGLVIGEHVYISPGAWLITSDRDIHDSRFSPRYDAIIIDDYAWIGPRATILSHITIGRGAVIQAGAVVTQDVAPNTVVGGAPAKVIGTRNAESLTYTLNHQPLFE